MTMEAQSKQVEFIIKNKLSYNEIAAYLGIHSGTFSEKINRKRGSKFTKPQLLKLSDYLNQLSKGINDLNQPTI